MNVKDLPDKLYVKWSFTDEWWIDARPASAVKDGELFGEYELKRIVKPKVTRTVEFE